MPPWSPIWGFWTTTTSIATETSMSNFQMEIWTMIWEGSKLLDSNLKELNCTLWLLSWKLKSPSLWFIPSLMYSSISIRILGFTSISLFLTGLVTMISLLRCLRPPDWRENILGQVLIHLENQPTPLDHLLFLKCSIEGMRRVRERLFLRLLSSKTLVKWGELLWKTL